MYPLRSAIRAQATRSQLQRVSNSATTSLLATTSSRRTVSAFNSTLPAVRGLHTSPSTCDKKWINQKVNEKASAIAEHDKGKGKAEGRTASADAISQKDKGAEQPTEKPASEVVPEENGIADEREQPSSPSSGESKGKETTSSTPSSTSSSNGAAESSSSSSGSSPPSSSSGNGDDSTSKPNTAITKLSIPEIYPQVLALPITRRPLFPG